MTKPTTNVTAAASKAEPDAIVPSVTSAAPATVATRYAMARCRRRPPKSEITSREKQPNTTKMRLCGWRRTSSANAKASGMTIAARAARRRAANPGSRGTLMVARNRRLTSCEGINSSARGRPYLSYLCAAGLSTPTLRLAILLGPRRFGGLDARLQRGHEVDDTCRRRRGGLGHLAWSFLRDGAQHPVAVLIRVPLRLERPGQGVDQKPRHLELLFRRSLAGIRVPEIGFLNLIRVNHRGQQHQVTKWADHTQITSRAQGEPRDRHPVSRGHRLPEDAEWGGPLAIWHHVVARLEIDGIDRGHVHKLLHIDEAAALGRQGRHLLAGHAHVLAG